MADRDQEVHNALRSSYGQCAAFSNVQHAAVVTRRVQCEHKLITLPFVLGEVALGEEVEQVSLFVQLFPDSGEVNVLQCRRKR